MRRLVVRNFVHYGAHDAGSFAGSLRHRGKTYSDTGKRGTRRSSGERAAEYENDDGDRVWMTEGGEVYSD